MEDEIFQLFNAENLKFLLKSRQKKVLLDDFSRFLAAYFLNFPPFLGKHNGTRLPTLLEWSDFGDEDIDTNRYQRISRRKVAEKLPPEFSPKFVALLLCRLEHYLEAALYTDYFNDFRSGLIIRYLTDIKHRITLFDDYCEKCLVEKLLTAAELLVDEPTNLVMKKFVEPYIEASLQIDLVFGKDFLDQIEEQAIFNMEILCFSLPDIVDESVRLPRPPIYSLPTQNSSAEPEVLTWNKIHFFMQIFLSSLRRTNRLHLLISGAISKIYRLSLLAKNDLSFYLHESDVNSLTQKDELNFSRLVLIVLKITYRDLLALSKRQGKPEEETMLAEKYSWLQSQEDLEKSQEILENWIESAEESDIQYLLTFLNFLQENNSQSEKFLPPLTSESLEKWKATFLGGISMNLVQNKNLDEPCLEWIWDGSRKMKIEPEDLIKIRFLAENFSSLSLHDPSLIQISLRIKAENLCETSSETISSSFDDFMQNYTVPKMEPITSLRESLRDSIKRLTEMEKNTYTSGSERLKIRPISREALRNFDSMMEKYNQQDIETELKKEQEFLQSIPYSSTSRALLEDLGPIHRIPIEKEPFPRTSTPKTFPRRMENHHERSTNLDRYGYLYDMPSTSKAAGYEPYQRISSPITFPRTREGSRNHVWDEGPSISETLELVPEVDLREELTQIGTKLSEIRQYLDQTTRNLKEKPKFVKKSLARQKRSARSWASSSSGLSSASSNMSIMSPMSSIVESRDVEQGHEGLRNGQKHLDTIFDNRSIASKQENIERYSQEASKSQKSREIEKKHSKSDKKLQQYKSVHDLHRESYSSQEESPLPSSFSQSPPRSRISSRRTQNFLQDLEPLPLPSLPQLEKLDLGLLSPEVKPKMAWKELSLYESETSKRDSAYTSTERSTEKGYNDWTKKGQEYIKTPEFKFPNWLKLIPPSDKNSSSKLLELRLYDNKQDNSTKPNQSNSYNQYNHIMPRVKSDRGFLVSSKEPVEQPSPQQQKVHFVTDMTEEQIQDLLKLCNA